MASKTWVPGTVIDSTWLQEVDDLVFGIELPADGDRNVATQRTGGAATTQHAINEIREYDLALEGGCVADGSTINNTAFAAALLAASAAGVPLRIRKGASYYRLTGSFTLPDRLVIILDADAELKWTATTGTGQTFLGGSTNSALNLGEKNKILGQGKITGPATGTYVLGQIGIYGKGTSTSARKSGFEMSGGVEVTGWGYAGLIFQFFDQVKILGNKINSCGHSGIFLLSCSHGEIQRNFIGDITPGDGSSNAYGISFTHDSTNYSADPNATTNGRLAVNPFCIDMDCSFNTVYNVSTWQGIDCHGGYEINIHDNKVYNCQAGISCSNSSGAAANYAGENNRIVNNIITTKKIDGSATSIVSVAKMGINCSGGSTVLNRNVVITGNTVDGYGDTVVTSHSISAQYVSRAIIADNIILNWQGYAFYTSNGEGVLQGNTFGLVSSITNSTCVYFDSSSGVWDAKNNRHVLLTGSYAGEGIRVFAGNPRGTWTDNNFDGCTNAYVGDSFNGTRGDSFPPARITVTGTPTTIDVGPAGTARYVQVRLTPSGPSTVTDLTNAKIGTVYELFAETTNATTFDRSNSALAGAANWVSTQYDTLVLLCISTSGTKFVERSRAANS